MLFAAVAPPLATRAVRRHVLVVDRVILEPNDQSPTAFKFGLVYSAAIGANRTISRSRSMASSTLAKVAPTMRQVEKSSALGQGRDDRRMLRGPRFLKVPIHKPSESVAKPDAAYPKEQLCLYGDLHAVGDLARSLK